MMLQKAKSGALQMAIYVGVLVALLLSGLILYAYTFLFVRQQSEMGTNNIALADSGIAYALEHQDLLGDTLDLSFHDTENQQLRVFASHWGVFRIVLSTARFRQKKFYKCALVGAAVNPETSHTLYLQDLDRPLLLVGSCLLKGNISAPHSGIQSGYVSGNGYFRDKLVYGTTSYSTRALPELDAMLKQALVGRKEAAQARPIAENVKKFSNSFAEPVVLMHDSAPIRLAAAELKGNIVIQSDSAVYVLRSAKLVDVVIRAPHIFIESGTTGRFQAIASNSIEVGENVKLDYPSALAVCPNVDSQAGTKLTIAKNSKICGVVLSQAPLLPNNYDAQVSIAENASVKGTVYCTANLELRGSVFGTVTAAQFVCHAGGTAYVNHILDGSIQNKPLPQSFAGALMENGTQKVALWLY